MQWHTVTHGRGSEGETSEWSGLIDYILGSRPRGPDAPRPFNRPFVPHINQRSPQSPTEVSDGPQTKGALFPQQGCRWPRCLISYYPLGPKGRSPDIYSFIDTNLIHNFFNINYIKLSSSTCFERHPLIFRRSLMLIVHVCGLWYSHSLQAAVLCTC